MDLAEMMRLTFAVSVFSIVGELGLDKDIILPHCIDDKVPGFGIDIVGHQADVFVVLPTFLRAHPGAVLVREYYLANLEVVARDCQWFGNNLGDLFSRIMAHALDPGPAVTFTHAVDGDVDGVPGR